MANPNIVNVTSIYGKTDVYLPTTTPTVYLWNDELNNQTYKLNVLMASNITTSAQTITIYYGAAGGIIIANAISVPANSSLTIIDKSNSIYIESGNGIFASASANSSFTLTASYEVIS